MYCKLALGNVRRSIRDYSVYFLTLTIGVCLFYVFNSIQAQKVLLVLNQNQNNVLDSLSNILGVLTIFVGIVLGFLIVYANHYLIRRRKKELGTYLILGMDKKNVSLILFLETIFIGVLAFICGILSGIIVSQMLVVVTAQLFMVDMKAFELLISTSAIFKAGLFYGLVFLIVILFNGRTISKVKLIELISSNRRNEQVKLQSVGLSVVLFIVSILMIIIAYIMILDNGFLLFDFQFLGSIIMGMMGTFLFFFSLSGFMLRFVQTRKSYYYRNLNMFVLRQFNSRINSNFVSMTMICIMLLITIGALGSGISLSDALSGEVDKVAPYDATVVLNNPEVLNDDWLSDMQQYGVDLEALTKEASITAVYDFDFKLSQFMPASFLETQKDYLIESYQRNAVEFISLSQFNQLLTMQGQQPIHLKENEYVATSTISMIQDATKELFASKEPLMIQSGTFYPYQAQVFDIQLMDFSMFSNFLTLVLPDDCFNNEQAIWYFMNVTYPDQAGSLSEEQFVSSMKSYTKQTQGIIQTFTKREILVVSSAIKLIISYIVIYVGLVFLIASAAVLALQQLSESADNIHRYALLRKMGVEEKMIRHSLFLQVAICFVTPLLLAILHSFVGISAVNIAMQQFGKLNIQTQILTTGGFIVLIYGGYFLITFTSCLNMIRKR